MRDDIQDEYTFLEWPGDHDLPAAEIGKEYAMVQYPDGEEARFLDLLDLSGFEPWDEEKLKSWKRRIIPDGWMAVMHHGKVVAACAALHECEWKPCTSEISYLVRDPEHAGHGIGSAVFLAATRAALAAGYRNILLRTNRANAISIYRAMGFVDAVPSQSELAREKFEEGLKVT